MTEQELLHLAAAIALSDTEIRSAIFEETDVSPVLMLELFEKLIAQIDPDLLVVIQDNVLGVSHDEGGE